MTIDEKTLKEIDQLNFENWMYFNEGLVKFIHDAPSWGRVSYEIFREGSFGKSTGLAKTLRRGVQFGVITDSSTRGGRLGLYRLTEAGKIYYRKILEEKVSQSRRIKEEFSFAFNV
jgi:hypothetical protein